MSVLRLCLDYPAVWRRGPSSVCLRGNYRMKKRRGRLKARAEGQRAERRREGRWMWKIAQTVGLLAELIQLRNGKGRVEEKRAILKWEQVLKLRCKTAHFSQTSIIGTAIHCQCQLLDEPRSKVEAPCFPLSLPRAFNEMQIQCSDGWREKFHGQLKCARAILQ